MTLPVDGRRASRRADELARDADLLVRVPRRPPPAASAAKVAPTPPRDPRLPMPGTILVRCYRGRTLQVKVLEQGFEYDDRIYRSLTRAAGRRSRAPQLAVC